ncbi:MAG: radical SAM protein [Bryobacterales bacterium]|nr:radical SAM protein [Bryobacterales bacterium]
MVVSGVADLPRPDNQAAGIGDGKHGFGLELPPSHSVFDGRPGGEVEGSACRLPYRNEETFVVPAPPLITFGAADIVNNCNLRCPFCVVDYSEVKKTELMTQATFGRLLELLPLLPDAGFWLSCLHEPTIHPGFEELLGMIPAGQGQKFWFTTNLARRMDDAMFQSWVDAGLHHVNVSLDTLDAELFTVLRKHGRLEVLLDNLNRMVRVFRASANAPRIRFISMVFESNFAEMEGIVRRCHEEWMSTEHEIRYMYNVAHVTDEFRQVHLLTRDRWPELSARLKDLAAPHVVICPPDEDYEEQRINPSDDFELTCFQLPAGPPDFTPPLKLRARHNGNIFLVGQEGRFSANVGTLADPAGFVRQAVREWQESSPAKSAR